MTLDDVYGSEYDRFPLEQERTPPARALEWNDATDGARRPVAPRSTAVHTDATVRAPLVARLKIARRFA